MLGSGRLIVLQPSLAAFYADNINKAGFIALFYYMCSKSILQFVGAQRFLSQMEKPGFSTGTTPSLF